MSRQAIGIAPCFRSFSSFRALPMINVHDLAVLPEARGRGVGRMLLEAVIAEAERSRCCKVTLETQERNHAARMDRSFRRSHLNPRTPTQNRIGACFCPNARFTQASQGHVMAHDHSSHRDHHHIVPGFGADRAAHYDTQASVSLAGVQAMYELGVSALTAQLDGLESASLLYVGLGTGAELVPYSRFGVPSWRFTGVDPSDAMLAVARKRLEAEGLLAHTQLHVGELHTLPAGPLFDGAQMMGVLHHVEGEEARLALLRELTGRLNPGAPLVLGCRVGNDPELMNVELRRWRTYGVSLDELEDRRQQFAALRPVASDAALFEMFARSGLVAPRPIFVSLQFKVFLVRFQPGAAD